MQIEKSQNVIIVGGGAVGVELAGEIMDKYKQKKVMIIHSGQELVNTEFGSGFNERIRETLNDKGIEFKLGTIAK